MTERVEDEAAKAIAQEIRQLIDTVNALIFGIDINGQINEWNQAAERITGYSKAEVMGHDLTDVFINQDYKASVKEALDRALTGEETASHEFPLYTKSGERVDVLLNLTALREAEGAIVGVVGVGQDIRGGEHAEEQLVPASRLAALDEMAANVAHDLKQPLSVIRMAVENSLQKIRNGSAEPEYLLEKLERISAQTERAAEIIDHMRTFSRKTAEWASPVNPRDEARRLAHTLKGAAGTLGLTELQAAARALEENLRSHDTRGNGDEVSHLMDAVSTEQNNLHEALTRITEQTVLENTLEADLVEAQKVLDHLVVLLEKDDTAANTLFLESEALLNSTFGPMAEQFGQQIEVFDYPAALNILDSLSTSSADTGSQVPVDVASSASEREDSPINPTGGG